LESLHTGPLQPCYATADKQRDFKETDGGVEDVCFSFLVIIITLGEKFVF